MKKNKLVFGLGDTSVWIEFANGTRSFVYSTKERALQLIVDHLREGDISKKEHDAFEEMIKQSAHLDGSLPGHPLEEHALVFAKGAIS